MLARIRKTIAACSRGRRSSRRGQSGLAYTELLIVTPLLSAMLLGAIDLGRLIFFKQVMTNLTREAGSLVSRGSTAEQTITATELADDPLDIAANGLMIISRIQRHNLSDPTPWIIEQVQSGALAEYGSEVGVENDLAAIPGIDLLDEGVTITAVEIFHDYEPVFALDGLGLNFYPEVLYDVSWF